MTGQNCNSSLTLRGNLPRYTAKNVEQSSDWSVMILTVSTSNLTLFSWQVLCRQIENWTNCRTGSVWISNCVLLRYRGIHKYSCKKLTDRGGRLSQWLVYILWQNHRQLWCLQGKWFVWVTAGFIYPVRIITIADNVTLHTPPVRYFLYICHFNIQSQTAIWLVDSWL